ncbi:MAG: hypothetical protein OEZ68_01655 [Gammaproteobacteria bacterium]|nr:hypothetical protein [Gammaproteobacteria bacterium]MDH5799485.1 hypothetical protein [Gammaproteobacteria bacterium]
MNRSKLAWIGLLAVLVSPVYGADDGEDSAPNGWEAKAALAFDSNIYRAPSDPYFDVAAGAPVDPKVQSGLFLPVRLRGKLDHSTNEDNRLQGSVLLLKDLYLDSKYRNADNTKFLMKFGNEHIISRKRSLDKKFYVGFKYVNNIDSYVDRDTGDEKLVGTTDISQRYRYTQSGINFDYKSRTTSPQYSFDMDLYNRKYEKIAGIKEYDYGYFNMGGEVKFRMARSSKLGMSYHYYTISYDELSARDANAAYVNVLREFRYHDIGVHLRQRLSKAMVLHLDYQYKLRQDPYQGYYDYTKNKLRTRLKYEIDPRQMLKLDFAVWHRDYPNAFAYDDPNENQKKYYGTHLKVNYDYQWDDTKMLFAQLQHWNENSSDQRYQFDRSILWLGGTWEF